MTSKSKPSITAFHRKLHAWYGAHGRKDLPWRHTQDAYHIYVSEVMLQQTQVKTVLERYYGPFLKRFPSLEALKRASRQEVLTAWQGLGYYSRAANLHKAAELCGRSLPQQVEQLMELPGIGRNTAHAIAAFAYYQPVPVMEANVKRIIARVFALEYPTSEELWEKAFILLDRKQPFDYNQAMMDIGSLVCTKRNPNCPVCPANVICEGQRSPESYPAPKTKKATPIRRKHIIVQQNAQGFYYSTVRTSRFLQGLYHFIEQEAAPTKATLLGHVTQQYSHFTLDADIWLMKTAKSGKDWYGFKQLSKLPMSMAEKKILQLLEAANSARSSA
ncbi:MAG: A/G-specific adenine glycosylase [Rickettsiales bacterium]|nr:A/G-specific adenine glycosylase [Rickettsiales bacterium]